MPYPIYRVMVSSTFLDLAPERKAVCDALRELAVPLGALNVALTAVDLQGGAASQPPLEVCLAEAANSDLLITVLGMRYGWVTPNGQSITEREYDQALKQSRAVLAYFKHLDSIVLPEHRETEAGPLEALRRFKQKIDGDRKRDVFSSPDALRGHVIRDVLAWILFQPQVADSIGRGMVAHGFAEIKAYLAAINSGDTAAATKTITSRRFELDMLRFGMRTLHQSLLYDMLELGSLARPTRITDPMQRSRLLLRYADHFRNKPSARIALMQASELEDSIRDAEYSFHVATEQVSCFLAGHDYELAASALKRMLRCTHQKRDIHLFAQATRSVGKYFRAKGDHPRALRWYSRGLDALCRMSEMCPFCLSSTFLDIGKELSSTRQCVLANDRFGKALMVAQAARDRQRQTEALEALAAHYIRHDDLRTGIAAYVWLARLVRDAHPVQEAADLGVLLGDVAIIVGHDKVLSLVNEVQTNPEQIVNEALGPYELSDFAQKLGIHPTSASDHW